MATIASAGNSDMACLQCLIDKGYKLKCVRCKGEERGTYVAEKGEHTFAAENGIELLGLVALWERWGRGWQEKGCGKGTWDKIEDVEYEEENHPS